VASRVPLRPSVEVLAMVQDRERQKRWLESAGIPLGDWMPARSAEGLADAQRRFGTCRLKASRDGYDGRGQRRVGPDDDPVRAWAEVGAARAVVEAELDLAAECSVLVARRPGGETAVFPVARNWHEAGILSHNVIPAGLPVGTEDEARRLARTIAGALALEGLLAVECFVLADGTVLVNELAPRPHNSFHATASACETSQFEQLVRAVCDLPLGSTRLVRPAALANLLGEHVLAADAVSLDAALAEPGIRVHLYGKSPRPGRKVGHLLATADTPEDAVRRVLAARERLHRGAAAAHSAASAARPSASRP
jgi:5-(carboxyamino)imidazole ribonucleotide synthase